MSGLPAVPSYTTFVTIIPRDTASDQAWSKTLGGHDFPEGAQPILFASKKMMCRRQTNRQILSSLRLVG
ncbi:Hypothetical protein FKW44_008191 [Caligus rogercresseyi]|uniref:Uncharacterized protein n=1 Tax=Caligus rogercresseyi TaxID=217165 RepID=A0A7T8QU39_CALRO|nr:Hypothetical protein FKW44_008191 [Caligus rogercresseyi]